MKLYADRVTDVTAALETRRDELPETDVERINRLLCFAEYSRKNEDDQTVANTFLSFAERVVSQN